MPTPEIRPLPEVGMVRIRIIEDDGETCLSEPCYPDTLCNGTDAWKSFADQVVRRTVKSREAVAEEQRERQEEAAASLEE